jgi:predicted Zn-dependent protease
VETAADLTGAEICAQAGSNPWGMVWLFGKFDTAGEGAKVEMLSDHPTNQHRITDLQRHFRELPALFAPYSSDERSATPLERPQAPADEDGGRHSPN